MSEEKIRTTEAAVEPQTDAMAIVMGDGGADKGADAKAVDAKAKRPGRTKTLPAGIAHITASFNNTRCAISDARGNVIAWCSSGRAGFKGSRKCTAFAGTMVAQDCARQAISKGMHEVEVRVQGVGAGRESAVRAIATAGLSVSSIKDITPIAHNGCRARKRRRV